MAFKVEMNSGTSFKFLNDEIELFIEQIEKGKEIITYEVEGKKFFLFTNNISAVYEI
ncbi:hypothetical protein ACQR3P_31975 [Rhodococcus sp. IEGM1300]